jgi:colanic acid biosynthesis glycosyl transferase WcaI
MRERVLAKGVGASRVRTIPVWSRADEVAPVEPSGNPLRAELGLGDRSS